MVPRTLVRMVDGRGRGLWRTVTCIQLASRRCLFGLFPGSIGRHGQGRDCHQGDSDLLFSDSLTVSLPSWFLRNTQLSKDLLSVVY